jgi:hypothetical protein
VHSVQSAVFIPRSFKEAMSSDHSHKWKEAIDKEISSLGSKGTFSYVPEEQAKGKKILPTRWVLATKQTAPASADSSSSLPRSA